MSIVSQESHPSDMGDPLIQDIQTRPVELWLRALALSPKSKTHVRSLLDGLVEFAMWAGVLEVSRNPISLVQNKGATRRVRKARSLTAEQYHALLKGLHEPFATMAFLCVCLGLRISEALALRWCDVDWLGSRLSIRRGIVQQHVDACKTESSAKTFLLAEDLVARLKAWKQASQFSATEDWVFASPFKRSRLDAAKTPIAVQQKMMRHTDIRTTMNIYGDVVTDEMSTASLKVAELAFHGDGAQKQSTIPLNH